MVHSKLMIVDDRILRIGSANLNNRSMGTDTECDLAIVAAGDAERRQIARIRARLLGDHCGVSADEAAAALAAHGSLLATAERLGARGHRFVPIQDGEPDLQELSAFLQSVADPERPIGAEEFVSQMFGGHVRPRQASTVFRLVAAAVVVLALTLLWHYTPLAGLANPERISQALAAFADGPWGPVVAVAAFVVGGLVAFPVTILIAATAAAFGPWAGCAYAAVGALTSAVVTYGLGAWLGKESLRKVLGPKLNRVRDKIARQGVIAIAAARMVPIAPFTVVNLVAGASEIRFVDFVFGTVLGLAPGLLVLSALGHEVTRILVHPTAIDYALLVCAVMLWVALSIGLQMLVSRLWSARS
jgi:phospholipase D1/2